MAEPGTLEWWLFNVPPMTAANIALVSIPNPIVQEEHRAVTIQPQTVAQRIIYEREVRTHTPE